MSSQERTPDRAFPALSGSRVLVAGIPSDMEEVLKSCGAEVVTVTGPDLFFTAGIQGNWEAAVWTVGPSGVAAEERLLSEVLERWRTTCQGIPLVVLSETVDATRARTALRGHAVDLIERDAGGIALAGALNHAIANRPEPLDAQDTTSPKRLLVVGAHPDDVEYGAGGIIHRRGRNGWEVTLLTLSRGASGGDPDLRHEEAENAAKTLGADLVSEDLPDGQITDSVSTVQVIERVVRNLKPDIVLVHSDSDTHQDHRAVHRVTMVAAREVDRLACYQSPSATVGYQPNRFVEIHPRDLRAKLNALRAHRSQAQTRAYLDESLIVATARYWGRFSHARYAEPLQLIRDTTPTGYMPGDED